MKTWTCFRHSEDVKFASKFSESEIRVINNWLLRKFGEDGPRKAVLILRASSPFLEVAVNGGKFVPREGDKPADYEALEQSVAQNVRIYKIWQDELTGSPVWGIVIDDYCADGVLFRDREFVVYDGMFLRIYNLVSGTERTECASSHLHGFADCRISSWIPWSTLSGVFVHAH